MTNIDHFAKIAAENAMRGAAEYIRVHKLNPDLDAVVAVLRQILRERLSEALADAKEAMDCGMSQIAETTFLASMRLCGHDAVKAVRDTVVLPAA